MAHTASFSYTTTRPAQWSASYVGVRIERGGVDLTATRHFKILLAGCGAGGRQTGAQQFYSNHLDGGRRIPVESRSDAAIAMIGRGMHATRCRSSPASLPASGARSVWYVSATKWCAGST